MGVSGEALQLHAVYKFTTSHVRLRISTTSHVSERALKLKVRMIKSLSP